MKCPKCNYQWVVKSRSNPQNSYYWGVVIDMLSENTGFTPDEMHEVLKNRFLNYSKKLKLHPLGISNLETQKLTKSTTALTTVEMEGYLSSIRTWASINLGCYIPEPNEVNNG